MRRFTRREFLGIATASAGALVACSLGGEPASRTFELEDVTIKARPGTPTESAVAGKSVLGLGTTRDGFLYVPATYRADTPAPLLILLHGAGRISDDWAADLATQFDDLGVVVVAPDSRFITWDLLAIGTYGPDVAFMDSALTKAFEECNIDPTRIAIGGFSDGAAEALGVGIANADLFKAIIAFSPGILVAPFRRGTPRIFVAHGTEDNVLPFARTRDQIVPALRQEFSVEFVQFAGGHVLPASIARQAYEWFATPAVPD